MRIIFLDIDGVLNSAEFANRHYEETGKPLFMYDFLDPDAVNRLKEFLDQHTDIRIVLSSSWRWGDYGETVEFLKDTGLKCLIPYYVGDTVRSYNGHRGTEVKHFIHTMGNQEYKSLWKDGEPFKIERYVIVDDDSDMLDEQLPYFVHTNNSVGITDDDYKKIEEILYA